VYDIGENSDCSVDARVSDNVADLVALFARFRALVARHAPWLTIRYAF
jgi:spore photoproduct lyase